MNSIACIFSLTCAILLNAPMIPGFIFAADSMPRVFIIDAVALKSAKQRTLQNNGTLQPALAKLTREADRALISSPPSVTRKEIAPPSGDRHDYMSLAPYWWPDPNTHNGLPYVRHDGKINPERDKIADRENLENTVTLVKTLALAYYFTANEDYARYATTLLQAWFLDPLTRMNPNLKYAQGIPGRNAGRAAGIIEGHHLPELVDAAGLLARSAAWSQAHQRQLQSWFTAFLTWLLESAQGRAEAQAENNHGPWYDVQIASFGLFTDKRDLAHRVLSDIPRKRIARQIEPDGGQPLELARADAWRYSLFNLQALFKAAALGDHLAIDLWNFETADKRSIRKALDWLIPFATGEKHWPLREQSRWHPERLAPLLQRAALRYRDPGYLAALGKLAAPSTDTRERLLYPIDEVNSYAK
ncbi:MAG TPA: alginate lyase family protein [Candidatus Polarisedimenticolaceae bacterium]|nr:alginate lyase family protein [Candidatus Polarisedimenticolaceae bacterium]